MEYYGKKIKIGTWWYITLIGLLGWYIYTNIKVENKTTMALFFIFLLLFLIRLLFYGIKVLRAKIKRYSLKKKLENIHYKKDAYVNLDNLLCYCISKKQMRNNIPYVKEKLKEIIAYGRFYPEGDLKTPFQIINHYYGKEKIENTFSDVFDEAIRNCTEYINISNFSNYELYFTASEKILEKTIAFRNQHLFTEQKFDEFDKKFIRNCAEIISSFNFSNYELCFKILEKTIVLRNQQPFINQKFDEIDEKFIRNCAEIINSFNLSNYELCFKILGKTIVFRKKYPFISQKFDEFDKNFIRMCELTIDNLNFSNYGIGYVFYSKIREVYHSSKEKKFHKLYEKIDEKIDKIQEEYNGHCSYSEKECRFDFTALIVNQTTRQRIQQYDFENGTETKFYIFDDTMEYINTKGGKKTVKLSNILKIDSSSWSDETETPTIIYFSTGGLMNVHFKKRATEWYFKKLIQKLKS